VLLALEIKKWQSRCDIESADPILQVPRFNWRQRGNYEKQETAGEGSPCARDAIFHPDKHPDWSLSLLISACFPVAKSRLLRIRETDVTQRGLRCETREKKRQERRGGKKRTVLESTRVRRLFVTRHGSPFLHEVLGLRINPARWEKKNCANSAST